MSKMADKLFLTSVSSSNKDLFYIIFNSFCINTYWFIVNMFSSWIELKKCLLDVKHQSINQCINHIYIIKSERYRLSLVYNHLFNLNTNCILLKKQNNWSLVTWSNHRSCWLSMHDTIPYINTNLYRTTSLISNCVVKFLCYVLAD